MWFDSEEQLQAAVAALKKLGPQARKLLAEVVEHTTVERTKPSATAEKLCGAGLLYIRPLNYWDNSVEYMASLWGEEALQALEEQEQKKEGKEQ